ncbi:RNA polymerase sigma factor [Sabulilitoribacter multivorans]|uniref:RNA polymerase sigma factor n=1 Tax=Flaviramulus multivorans TaxID=1304750 RepID=A0ABS9IIH4_9FLAO|nr:RNA polymerase sigma factor [Flaviramulus multivorans]MCF7560563.1 RNA polymerase sigma factor [Flaviramulus multivorans]
MGKSLKLLNQSELVYAIKSNDSNILKHFYTTNYKKIETLILKNSGSIDYAKDIYQDAFIAVWTHVKNDKFVPKNDTALQAYLYTIAKNKWMDYLRSNDFKKISSASKLRHFEPADDFSEKTNDDKLKTERLHKIMHTFKNLGEPCKSLLTKFYFEKKSMKDIADEFLLDAASTRNKKYRCMQKLRELALKIE